MISFKKYLKEDNPEITDKEIKAANKWLKNKYGNDVYNFKYIKGLTMDGEKTKSYDISVDNQTYTLNLKKFETSDGKIPTLGFDVFHPIEDEEDEL